MKEDAAVASTVYVGLLDEWDVGESQTWKLNKLVGPNSKGFTQITLIEAEAGYVFYTSTLNKLLHGP